MYTFDIKRQEEDNGTISHIIELTLTLKVGKVQLVKYVNPMMHNFTDLRINLDTSVTNWTEINKLIQPMVEVGEILQKEIKNTNDLAKLSSTVFLDTNQKGLHTSFSDTEIILNIPSQWVFLSDTQLVVTLKSWEKIKNIRLDFDEITKKHNYYIIESTREHLQKIIKEL